MKQLSIAGLFFVLACQASETTAPIVEPTDISPLQVGEVAVLEPLHLPDALTLFGFHADPRFGGIDLPAAAGDREYIIIIANTDSAHDVVANYSVKADVETANGVFAVETAADMSAKSSALRLDPGVERGPTTQETIDSKVRGFERSGLSLRFRKNPVSSDAFSIRRNVQVAAAPVPAVGDIINVKVPQAASTDLCNNFVTTQATVASVSRRAILAVDTLDGNPNLVFTQAVMDSITDEFDNITYPTDSSYFNNPTDIDGNAHIILLFTGEINKLTPPNTSGGFVGGFFFAGDLFPPTDQGGGKGSFCPESNQAEIFYLLSPDPTGRFGNVRTTSSVRQGTRGTIAHEFQHMINAGNRFLNPKVEHFEATWLDEALAHFAEDAVGRVVRHFGDLQTLTFTDVLPCASPCQEANAFNAFFFQNLARLSYWMDTPGQFSPMSKMADTSLATRGAAWAILRYAADNYSNADPRKFTQALVAGPDTGVKNFTKVSNAPVDTLVERWLVSMYADHLSIPNLSTQYQYRSYDFHSVMPPVAKSILNQSTAAYPLRIQAIGSGTDNIASMNRSGTGTYYRLTVPSGQGPKSIRIVDAAGQPVTFPGEHLYVLRVQ